MFGFEISEGLKQKLDSFCKEHDCELFPVFLATLQSLLFRYTSQKEIAVFTRTALSSPKLVQFPSNLDGSLTFNQLLGAAKE